MVKRILQVGSQSNLDFSWFNEAILKALEEGIPLEVATSGDSELKKLEDRLIEWDRQSNCSDKSD